MRLSDYTDRLEFDQLGLQIAKAAAVACLAYINEAASPLDVAKSKYPDDRDVQLIVRAATSPASMTVSGWASQLVQTAAVADFNYFLGSSAVASLFPAGQQYRYDGNGALSVSGLSVNVANAAFVLEGGAIPVRQDTFTSKLLAPRKIATICVYNRELFKHSLPNIELAMRSVMSENIGLAADKAALDAVAGDATRPAGLLNGISTLTPTPPAAVPTPALAMEMDIANMLAQVMAVAGNSPVYFIASPKQAAALRLWGNADFNTNVLVSTALADRTVVCVAANAIASACDPIPRFMVSEQSALHMSDTPAEIGAVGSPPVVAAPVRSLFQTDSIGLRAIWECSWTLRNAAGLAYINLVNW
jgi:hypothetical protein